MFKKAIAIILVLFLGMLLCGNYVKAYPEQEKPIFRFGLSDTWGLLNVYVDGKTYQEPYDFVFETIDYRFAVQTTPYSNLTSVEYCDIFVYKDQFRFVWKLVDGAHEEFVSATICNKENNEATTFNIENSGSIYVPYHSGLNNYDLYCYTGRSVGLFEFDLFDVLIIYVEEK